MEMAGLRFALPLPVTKHRRIMLCVRFCSSSPENPNRGIKKETPAFLKISVSGVTELLRLFSFFPGKRSDLFKENQENEILVSGVDDVLTILKSDYENAYFVTDVTGGKHTRALFVVTLCTFTVGRPSKGKNKEDKEIPELPTFTTIALRKDYKQRAST